MPAKLNLQRRIQSWTKFNLASLEEYGWTIDQIISLVHDAHEIARDHQTHAPAPHSLASWILQKLRAPEKVSE